MLAILNSIRQNENRLQLPLTDPLQHYEEIQSTMATDAQYRVFARDHNRYLHLVVHHTFFFSLRPEDVMDTRRYPPAEHWDQFDEYTLKEIFMRYLFKFFYAINGRKLPESEINAWIAFARGFFVSGDQSTVQAYKALVFKPIYSKNFQVPSFA
jgi:hypothetical protein